MRQNDFYAVIHKTLKINIDDSSHGLPPSCGVYSEYKVADYDCPKEWSKDGVFIPVKEGEPMWFDFTQNGECAIIVAVQKVNPVTGERVELKLAKDPKQNYLRMPEQRWLDGYANEGKVYQFIVTKSGLMSAVNEYVLPVHEQDSYAIGFAFFDLKNPKPKPVFRDIHHYHHETLDYGCFGPVYGNSGMKKYLAPASGILRSKSATKYGSSGFCSNGGMSAGTVAPQGMNNWDDGETEAFIGACADVDEVQTSFCVSPVQSEVSDADIAEVQEQLKICANDPDLTIVTHHNAEALDHTAFEKASMGQGGRIVQEIYTDPNTVEYYVAEPSLVMNFYLCLPEQFDAIIKKGRISDPNRKDQYTHSGKVGGVQVPLIK